MPWTEIYMKFNSKGIFKKTVQLFWIAYCYNSQLFEFKLTWIFYVRKPNISETSIKIYIIYKNVYNFDKFFQRKTWTYSHHLKATSKI